MISMSRGWLLALRSARKNSWHNGEPRPRGLRGKTLDSGCLCLSRGMFPPDQLCPKHGEQIRKAEVPHRLSSKKFKG
jgi:hypothetical protein